MSQHIQVDLGSPVWIEGFEISGGQLPTHALQVSSFFPARTISALVTFPTEKVAPRYSIVLLLSMFLSLNPSFGIFIQEGPSYSEARWNTTDVRETYFMLQSRPVTFVSSLKLGNTLSLYDSSFWVATPPARIFTSPRHLLHWTKSATTR